MWGWLWPPPPPPWSIQEDPNPSSTCHVGRLGENILLCAACPIVFLCEVGVRGCISQSGGGQKHVHAWAKHPLEIIGDQSTDFLGLYEVVLEVPVETIVYHTQMNTHTPACVYSYSGLSIHWSTPLGARGRISEGHLVSGCWKDSCRTAQRLKDT